MMNRLNEIIQASITIANAIGEDDRGAAFHYLARALSYAGIRRAIRRP